MSSKLLLASFFLLAPAAIAQSLTGLWDATVTDKDLVVPFRMEFSGTGAHVQGSLINGDDKFPSTRGRFENGALLLNFDHLGSKLEATWKDGRLQGIYTRASKATYAFDAQRYVASNLTSNGVPAIAGLWEVEVKSPKGESAWQFIVRQSGPEVSAAILRVDGDTGTLAGQYRDGKFRLSHFAGGTPMLLEVTPRPDGTLDLVRNGKDHWTAVPQAQARAQGLPEPDDPAQHTSVKDPAEPFRFEFPGVDGKVVSNTDPRFQDKVVIVAISGSWCPNCHDEAPFLESLYRKYHSRGLEIVALSFEEPEQQKDLTRLRAFIHQYNIDYTVLIPGEPSELQAKLPQTVNLNAFPTTFFLGRDGRVRSVHAGFAGPASGRFHEEREKEISTLVERLLADNQVSAR